MPCDKLGDDLPSHAPPPHTEQTEDSESEWYPFNSRLKFDFAWYHFVEVESSECNLNKGLDLWATSVLKHGGSAPWKSATELHETIDAIQHGDAPWKTYQFHYQGPLPPTPPQWMMHTYKLCVHDTHQVLCQQFANPEFKDKINYTPYRQFNKAGKCVWSNFMSRDWAWKQVVSLNCPITLYIGLNWSLQDIIAEDAHTHGSVFIPVVAGSDKTTVSVMTGHQEYHPVYQLPSNFKNIVH